MSLTRKRKKELRRLQNDATELWEHQQELVGHAAGIAREASRQLGNVGREQVLPVVQDAYRRNVAPAVDRGVKIGHRQDEAGPRHRLGHRDRARRRRRSRRALRRVAGTARRRRALGRRRPAFCT